MPRKDIICFKCGIAGHYASRCPSRNPGKCRRFGKAGHLRLDCPDHDKNIHCRRCDKTGHYQSACRRRDSEVKDKAPKTGPLQLQQQQQHHSHQQHHQQQKQQRQVLWRGGARPRLVRTEPKLPDIDSIKIEREEIVKRDGNVTYVGRVRFEHQPAE